MTRDAESQAVSEGRSSFQPSAASEYERHFDTVPRHHPPDFPVNDPHQRLQTLTAIGIWTEQFHDLNPLAADIELAHGLLGGPMEDVRRTIGMAFRQHDKMKRLIDADALAEDSLTDLIADFEEHRLSF
jgi:hypothetical protein